MDTASPPSASEPKRLPKRIIICCDGTWLSATSGVENVPSNVTRLARCLKRIGTDEGGQEWQQVVWYDSGVGTTSGWLGRQVEGAFGNGLEVKVIEAYHFCALNYSPGDKIMCFGFSRGAYTARSIAGLISDVGICKPHALQTFHELWTLYKKNPALDGQRFWKSTEWLNFVYGVAADVEKQPDHVRPGYVGPDVIYERQPHPEWKPNDGDGAFEIEVVGVWDTVGALGFPNVLGFKPTFGPDKNGYHNVQLSPNIKNAFQALALDEHRSSFSPTLWYLPDPEKQPTEEALQTQWDQAVEAAKKWESIRWKRDVPKKERHRKLREWQKQESQFWWNTQSTTEPSKLLQVWFPGCHVNVGGGSSDTLEQKGDLEELAGMTFAWMLDQIREYVSIDIEAYMQQAEEQSLSIMHLNMKLAGAANEVKAHQEEVANSGWGRYLLENGKYYANRMIHLSSPAPSTKWTPREQTWGLGEIIDSYAGMYRANGSWRRTPGNYTMATNGQLGVTEEYIHPSVGYRMDRHKKHENPKQVYGPFLWDGKDFKRKRKADGSGWEYEVKGSRKPITEWRLKDVPENASWWTTSGRYAELPYERFVVHGEDAQEYVRALDRGYNVLHHQPMGNPPEWLAWPPWP